MQIWLDDLRCPLDYGYPDAVWFKTSQEFMSFLEEVSKPYRRVTEWHMDNDLGQDSEQEGYDCFLALEEHIVFGKMLIAQNPVIFVHTSNPAAAQKFMLAKESMAKYGVQMIRKHY